VREELQNAHDLYVKAFNGAAVDEYLPDPGLRLKQALVKRIDALIVNVDKELNARA
jgi:hypothetical protein